MNPLNLTTKLVIDESVTSSPNLADRFTPEDLKAIGGAVWDGYDRDQRSRQHWLSRMEAGMDMALQVQKAKTFPWPGAANVVFPLVTIAALQFSARSYENIIQGTDVVRYRALGQDTSGELRKRADRISKHMSWQVLEEDSSWEEQHDRLLINLGIVGTTLIKTYFSARLGHNVSELVMARDFVVDYWAKSVDDAARKTHVFTLFRNEIYERVKSKTFCDILNAEWYTTFAAVPEDDSRKDDRQGIEQPQPDSDTPFKGLEQHCYFDFDQDGYAEPYIITIEEKSQAVLRIVSRWESDQSIERLEDGSILRIKAEEYFTKFGFIPAADGGFYDIGFGVLLGPLNESVNSGINQLIDAGTMANSNGGFLGRGAKIRGGVYTFAPWEWQRIDSTGDDIRKSMVQLPVREPSNVMLSLLSLLIDYTDRVAGTVDQAVGKNPGQNTPAETSRNSLEQGMRVYASIFKRVWRSLKEEFKKLHSLNGRFLPATKYFGEKNDFVRREDYSSNPDQVVPVADPNVTSNQMRIAQAISVRQAAAEMPGYDRPLVEKRMLRAMQVEGIDEIYPGADKVPSLPNPKMQIEEGKMKIAAMKIEFEKQKLMMELMEVRKKNQAEILKLQAETVQIMASVQTEQATLKLKAYETIVDSLETHNNILNNTIQTLSSMQGDKQDGNTSPEGVGTPPNAAGNPGPSGGAPAVAAGANGAMGAGTVQ